MNYQQQSTNGVVNNYTPATPPVPRLQEITLSGKGKLILTKDLMDQIDYLHTKVGAIEWCGVLFFKKISGEISSSEDFVLQAEQIYPMNIGSEAYTESELAGLDIVDMYDKCNPNYELKQGLIHTHHTMAAFFSGTDMAELHDNVGNHNYYLSLIVNFNGVYVARIAYVAEVKTEQTYTFNNSEDISKSVKSEFSKKVMVMMDLDIIKPEFQEVVPTYFQDRFLEIKQKKATADAAKKSTYSYTPSATYPAGGTKTWTPTNKTEETGSAQQGKLFNTGTSASAKAKELEKGQKGSGKLVNTAGLYISIPQEEMRSLILQWMNKGLDTSADMIPTGGDFVNIGEALKFFDDYFELEPSGLDYFLTTMQKEALGIFQDYSMNLIKNRATAILSDWIDNIAIATDLYNIMDTIDVFKREMQSFHEEKGNEYFIND